VEEFLKEEQEIEKFIDIFPEKFQKKLFTYENFNELIEVILDLGKRPEARFLDSMEYLSDDTVEISDIEYVIKLVGDFDRDNRSGIERTLHRISAIRNRKGQIVGLTCRVGRAINGVIDIVKDLFETGKSVLLLGRPGVGKTTILREAARILSLELKKRVVVVDTSNEIAGDGDVPHPGIGISRRMQVPFDKAQYQIMIEAVENHMPEVIIIDEIGIEEEASACRTIAERGVQLIATAHGNTLDNLIFNPTLSDLVGGITSVILSDEEAARRGTQKTVLERTSSPTFDILIEIHGRNNYAIYKDVSKTVDSYLRGFNTSPELRIKDADGSTKITKPKIEEKENNGDSDFEFKFMEKENRKKLTPAIKIYPFGISSSYLARSIHSSHSNLEIIKNVLEANIVLTTEAYRKKNSESLKLAEEKGIPVYSIPSNTLHELKRFINDLKNQKESSIVNMNHIEKLIENVIYSKQPLNLPPANPKIRRIEHQIASRYGLNSESYGDEPRRFVVVYPLSIMEEN
jgi:stage III sporulation protein SpoIIIAA